MLLNNKGLAGKLTVVQVHKLEYTVYFFLFPYLLTTHDVSFSIFMSIFSVKHWGIFDQTLND